MECLIENLIFWLILGIHFCLTEEKSVNNKPLRFIKFIDLRGLKIGNLYLYRYGNEECLTLSIHPNAAAEGAEDGIRFDYDEQNNRIRAHYPDGGCERYFYDGTATSSRG